VYGITMRHHSFRSGFLLLDALVGITVFAFFVGIAGFSLLLSQQTAIRSGDRVRASMLSEQAIEAVRSVRDADFGNLAEGQYGVSIGTDGTWQLTGTGSLSEDGFVTSVQLQALDDDQFELTATTTWTFDTARFGSVILTAHLANWRKEKEIGNWAAPVLDGAFVDTSNPLFNAVTIMGEYAFVTSEISSGGAGLYVLDISNPALPIRVSDGFSLGVSGYELIVSGNVLFVLTGDDANEVRAYNISDPNLLSSDQLLGTYNIPGVGRARSLALFGTTLYVGAQESTTGAEFYALDVSAPAQISLMGFLDIEGGVLDVALYEGYAYLGSTQDVGELVVIDVFDPQDMVVMECGGCNLTDVPDGQAVGAFNGIVLLGRSIGDFIQELVLFSIAEGPAPAPPPQPKYYGVDANVNGLAWEPTGTYAFLATDDGDQELQVIDINRFQTDQFPRVASVDTTTGNGRSVTYDAFRDRVFLTTNGAVLLYAPGP